MTSSKGTLDCLCHACLSCDTPWPQAAEGAGNRGDHARQVPALMRLFIKSAAHKQTRASHSAKLTVVIPAKLIFVGGRL